MGREAVYDTRDFCCFLPTYCYNSVRRFIRATSTCLKIKDSPRIC